MNEIYVISPYKHHGMWVFDDARVGLLQEPFVAGADTSIDRVVADIPNAEKGFMLIFSRLLFPVISIVSTGGAKKVAATGTTRLSWTWRAGFAPRYSNSSQNHQSSCSFKPRAEPRPRTDDHRHSNMASRRGREINLCKQFRIIVPRTVHALGDWPHLHRP